MKTDLSKILSVSGQHGLFNYLAQSRNGVVVEALSDKRRTCFDSRNRLTALENISIYTSEGELKLKEVFRRLHDALGDEDAPGQKASSDEVEVLFAKAVPDYDSDRFHVSHMKKIIAWYNELKNCASLDFSESGEAEHETQEEKAEDEANA